LVHSLVPLVVSSSASAAHRDVLSFPPRRSSDLMQGDGFARFLDGVFGTVQARLNIELARRCDKADNVSRVHFLGNALSQCLAGRSEEHTSELQSRFDLVCRLLLEKKTKSVCHGW